MLESADIISVVTKAARTKLGTAVQRIEAEPAFDSEGNEALRITVIVEAKAVSELSGDQVLDALTEIQNRLKEAGETRLAIVGYATKQELRQRASA